MTNPDGFTRPLSEGPTFSRGGMPRNTFNVRAVLHDSGGNIWIGTLGQGLLRLRADSNDVREMERFSERDGLSAQFVWCLLEDREHNVWVGTQNGLNRFRDEKITTLTRREGLASDDVDALAAGPNGSVWASTPNGVNRIDGAHRDLYLAGHRHQGIVHRQEKYTVGWYKSGNCARERR